MLLRGLGGVLMETDLWSFPCLQVHDGEKEWLTLVSFCFENWLASSVSEYSFLCSVLIPQRTEFRQTFSKYRPSLS